MPLGIGTPGPKSSVSENEPCIIPINRPSARVPYQVKPHRAQASRGKRLRYHLPCRPRRDSRRENRGSRAGLPYGELRRGGAVRGTGNERLKRIFAARHQAGDILIDATIALGFSQRELATMHFVASDCRLCGQIREPRRQNAGFEVRVGQWDERRFGPNERCLPCSSSKLPTNGPLVMRNSHDSNRQVIILIVV